VQHAGRLARAGIDRHARLEVVVADLDDLDAEVLEQRPAPALARVVERNLLEPDRRPTRASPRPLVTACLSRLYAQARI
jgi:hypothetical protein